MLVLSGVWNEKSTEIGWPPVDLYSYRVLCKSTDGLTKCFWERAVTLTQSLTHTHTHTYPLTHANRHTHAKTHIHGLIYLYYQREKGSWKLLLSFRKPVSRKKIYISTNCPKITRPFPKAAFSVFVFYIYFELIVYKVLETLSKIFRLIFVFDQPILSEKY